MQLNTENGGVILSAANPLAMEIDKIQQFANIQKWKHSIYLLPILHPNICSI